MDDLTETRHAVHEAAERLELALRRLPVTKRARLYNVIRDVRLAVAYADLVIDRAAERQGWRRGGEETWANEGDDAWPA